MSSKQVAIRFGTVSQRSVAKAYSGSSGQSSGGGGDGGIDIYTTSTAYAVGDSQTVPPTSGWQDTIPEVESGKYLWSRLIITYTDYSTTTFYTVGAPNSGSSGDFMLKDGTNAASLVKFPASTSFQHGVNAQANGSASHAEGYGTRTSNSYSHAEGSNTSAFSNYSHAEGYGTRTSGSYSHAEGYSTTSYGYGSHSEGYQSTSYGSYSHAEGSNTSAFSNYSHAEGYGTRTSGSYSHAEGTSTSTTGQASHSEGYATKADGTSSHAEGSSTISSGIYSHAEGNITIANGSYSHAEGDGTFASSDASHSEGYGSRAIGKYSHTEGYNTLNSGVDSHAEGYESFAYGHASHAEGYESFAYGNSSHAEGAGWGWYDNSLNVESMMISQDRTTAIIVFNSSTVSDIDDLYRQYIGVHIVIANNNLNETIFGYCNSWNSSDRTLQIIIDYIGDDVQAAVTYTSLYTFAFVPSAYGSSSHAEGTASMTNATSAHAEGYATLSSGQYSHAEGWSTSSIGIGSHAEGEKTESTGNYTHAEGYGTRAIHEASHAEGRGTTAQGNVSHAEGYGTISILTGSHAEGYFSSAYNIHSHAEGRQTYTMGNYSHGEGYLSTTYGDYSHAEGYATKTIGESSHSEGYSTITSSIYSHAEGEKTFAYGDGSHTEGYGTVASGNYSHAEGWESQSIGLYSHAEGGFDEDLYKTVSVYEKTTSNDTIKINVDNLAGDITIGDEYLVQLPSYSTDLYNGIITDLVAEEEGSGEFIYGVITLYGHKLPSSQISSGTSVKLYYGYNMSRGNYSHVEGLYTRAIGKASHAEGHASIASGNYSKTFGEYTQAEGVRSIAGGLGAYAKNTNGIAIGTIGLTSGGNYRTATGTYPGIFYTNQAYSAGVTSIIIRPYTSGDTLTAYLDNLNQYQTNGHQIWIGFTYTDNTSDNIQATFNRSSSTTSALRFTLKRGLAKAVANLAGVAVYVNTITRSSNATALGAGVEASGQYSEAHGLGTQAKGIAQFVAGTFNDISTSNTAYASRDLIQIGNGKFDARSNAFTVRNDGTIGATNGLGIQTVSDSSKYIKFGVDASGNYGYYKSDDSTLNLFGSGGGSTENYMTIDGLNASSTVKFKDSSFAHGSSTNFTYNNYSHAEGYGASSYGGYSHAEGMNTYANGSNSHAEGYYTSAYGNGSHSEGANTRASGAQTHAEGYMTLTSAAYAHAEGYQTSAYNQGSHSEGSGAFSSGTYSHSEGYQTTTYGSYSHTEGYQTSAFGSSSHAEGLNTTSYGNYSHAEGSSTYASATYSHAEGNGTRARGNYSHSEGGASSACGANSHAEGFAAVASSNCSHAEGYYTTSYGIGSHTEGIGTLTSYAYTHAAGEYNDHTTQSSSNYDLLQIGNGTSAARSNAFTVRKDGSIGATNGLGIQLKSDNSMVIKFGVDASGNYGYYKDGADTVTPFKSAPNLQAKTTETLAPTAQWSSATTTISGITADAGYDGLSSVTVTLSMLRDGHLMNAKTVTQPGTVYNGDTAQTVTGNYLRLAPTKNGYSFTGSYLYLGPSTHLGDATAADVASGKTFSSSAGIQSTGTMATNSQGDVVLSSADYNHSFAAGYYPSSFTVSMPYSGAVSHTLAGQISTSATGTAITQITQNGTYYVKSQSSTTTRNSYVTSDTASVSSSSFTVNVSGGISYTEIWTNPNLVGSGGSIYTTTAFAAQDITLNQALNNSDWFAVLWQHSRSTSHTNYTSKNLVLYHAVDMAIFNSNTQQNQSDSYGSPGFRTSSNYCRRMWRKTSTTMRVTTGNQIGGTGSSTNVEVPLKIYKVTGLYGAFPTYYNVNGNTT